MNDDDLWMMRILYDFFEWKKKQWRKWAISSCSLLFQFWPILFFYRRKFFVFRPRKFKMIFFLVNFNYVDYIIGHLTASQTTTTTRRRRGQNSFLDLLDSFFSINHHRVSRMTKIFKSKLLLLFSLNDLKFHFWFSFNRWLPKSVFNHTGKCKLGKFRSTLEYLLCKKNFLG